VRSVARPPLPLRADASSAPPAGRDRPTEVTDSGGLFSGFTRTTAGEPGLD
jgi:hypothetical protein